MNLLLGLVLLAAALAILAYPLSQSRPRALIGSSSAFSELAAQRDGLYATLRDLDLDYELGKLDVEDYATRREKYLARASVVLQQLDLERTRNGEESDLGDEIEREVAALRLPPSDTLGSRVTVVESIDTTAQPVPARRERRKWLGGQAPNSSADRSSAVTPPDLSTGKNAGPRANVQAAGVRGGQTRDHPSLPNPLVCPNCGRVYNEGDRFCGRCGHTLP